jgi:predicted alpha/beta-hydrolase family hydrolase
MRILERVIDLGPDGRVSSLWAMPPGYAAGGAAVALAHGAGNDMHSPFLSAIHLGLAERGLLSVKFNFPYAEQGRRAPDRMPRLEAAWRGVLTAVRGDPELAPGRLFLGGKSMGGRVASHLAAAGARCEGLLFLGYPLHPAGKPERLRDSHLAKIACPMLFVEGTRDPLCRLELLQPVLARLGTRARLHLIAGGDHSFRLPKRLGRSEREVWDEILEAATRWMAEV